MGEVIWSVEKGAMKEAKIGYLWRSLKLAAAQDQKLCRARAGANRAVQRDHGWL